ncbi:hypothetical protein HU200_001196 [Digitaria exilis]|uniref:Expansin-like EG45 domain-containing protein n=1 Tax=Digitaria exilis TaxID=1010633 RepID=A0A835L0C5_9POAL|nr:hypothetical protein HU200_001196 [Digitaria exilis]
MGSLVPIVVVAIAAVLAALAAVGSCDGSVPKVPPGPNITTDYNARWLAAKATWYGSPVGAGPDDNGKLLYALPRAHLEFSTKREIASCAGGACGIKNVDLPPYSGMTSCGNAPIFKDGRGCGSCYRIRCKAPAECSNKPVTVFVTDMNYDPISAYHFDLSGSAFGSMAKPGLGDKLRHRGIIDLEFRRSLIIINSSLDEINK